MLVNVARMINATAIVRLHDAATLHGHHTAALPAQPATDFEQLVLAQHQANFELWHEEDRARDPDAPDAVITAVKHSIDRLNQQRNDLVEQIDAILFLGVTQKEAAPLHSETPGLIIDRLSILALKRFHTEQETHRSTPVHRERNTRRLQVLTSQRDDLSACLDNLWADITTGRRRFKLYRQMKMYNDPTLNPALYNH